jgi:hypothetical protein
MYTVLSYEPSSLSAALSSPLSCFLKRPRWWTSPACFCITSTLVKGTAATKQWITQLLFHVSATSRLHEAASHPRYHAASSSPFWPVAAKEDTQNAAWEWTRASCNVCTDASGLLSLYHRTATLSQLTMPTAASVTSESSSKDSFSSAAFSETTTCSTCGETIDQPAAFVHQPFYCVSYAPCPASLRVAYSLFCASPGNAKELQKTFLHLFLVPRV